MNLMGSIFLVVCTHCNINCRYCYVDKAKREAQYDYDRESLEAVNKFVEKAYNENVRFKSITLHGSETTVLSPQTLTKILNKLANISKHLSFQTNGVNLGNMIYFKMFHHLLTPEAFDKLHLGFSLDGPKIIHDYNRDNTYDIAMQGYHNCKRSGVKCGSLGVITRHTLDHLDELGKWVDDMKRVYNASISFQYENSTDTFTIEDEKKFVKWGLDTGKIYLLTSFKENNYANMGNGCQQLVFDKSGNVYGCNRHYGAGVVSMSSWFTTSFRDLIEERKGYFSEDKYPVDEDCLKCKWYKFCHGGCPTTRYTNQKANDCYTKKMSFKVKYEKEK